MRNKKIFIIGTTASNLYLFRKDFLKSCVAKEIEVYTLISEYDDYWLDKIKSLNCKIITYNLSRSGLNPFNDLKSVLELRRLIVLYKPDIVFSFFSKPVIYGSLAAKLSGSSRIIGMIEGLGSPFTEHPSGTTFKMKLVRFFQVTLYRLIFPFIHKIIFLNHDDPVDLIEKNKIFHRKGSVKVLGGIGLNLNDYPYKEWDNNNPLTFIIVARLLVEKGIYEFLAAASILKKTHPDVVFKIVGGLDLANPSGITQEELNEVIASGVIQYVGFTDNIVKEITESAVFVLPSYREGVPRSSQEAAAIGRPIITTDVPGCRDTVVDGLNGFLVPKWDVSALVEKMLYFVDFPEQVNVMGKESYKLACERFDVHTVNKKLFQIMGVED